MARGTGEGWWMGMTVGGVSFAEKSQTFHFHYIAVKYIRCPRDDVEQAIGYLRLEHRREVWFGNINLEVISIDNT